MEITFDEKQDTTGVDNGMLYHYGEVVSNGKEYPFTLCECISNGCSAFDVTWIEEEFDVDENLLIEKLEEE